MKPVQEAELADCLTELELFSFFPKFGLQPTAGQEETAFSSRKKRVKVLLDPAADLLKQKLEQQGRIDFYREGETVYFCFADALAVCREQAENAVSELVFSSVLPCFPVSFQNGRFRQNSFLKKQGLWVLPLKTLRLMRSLPDIC